LSLKTHLYARIAVAFLGFFGGFALFVFLVFGKPLSHGALAPVLFFTMLFGGGYLAQLAFSHAVPAACPACGQAAAVASVRQPAIYVCRACGVASNAAHAMLVDAVASMPSPEQQQKREVGVLWIFLVVGVGLIGIAVWLAEDSIHLLREGVSTDARVMRVTRQASRDSDGHSETSYTAYIDFRVGKGTMTLTRSWSVKDGSHCMWPCYDQGEALKVIYLPSEPSIAKVHSVPGLFFAPALIGTVGLAFAAFGVFAIRQRRRRPRLEL